MAKIIKIDWLELILEDFYNFLLQKAYKPKYDIHYFKKDFTSYIVIFIYSNSLS